MGLSRAATSLAVLALGASPAHAADTEKLSDEHSRTSWAYVDNPTPVRAAPSAHSPKVGQIREFTFYGLREVVVVLRRTVGLERPWYRVRYPGIGRRTGWIRTPALRKLRTSTGLLIVDRRRRAVRVYRRGRLSFRAPAGIGAGGSPTPGGRYYLRERLVPSSPNGIYGVLAFGLSSYSRYRTDWPGGGQVGIHGTNEPRLIPGRISNGCVRLRNRDARRVDRLVGVVTPVLVK